MHITIEVVPAYVRVYTNKNQVTQAWNEEEQDFRIVSVGVRGSYISKRDADKYNLSIVCRYGKDLEKVMVLREKK